MGRKHTAYPDSTKPEQNCAHPEESTLQVTLRFLLGHKDSNYHPSDSMPNLCDGKKQLVALLHLFPESGLSAGGASLIIWIIMHLIVHVLPQTQVVCLAVFTETRGDEMFLEHLCWYFLLQGRECRNTRFTPTNVMQLPGQTYSKCFSSSACRTATLRCDSVEHELSRVRPMPLDF